MQQRLSVHAAHLILISGLYLAGCATTKEDLLPQEGPSMLDIYEGHLDRVGQGEIAPRTAQRAACRTKGDDGDESPESQSTPGCMEHEKSTQLANRQYGELVDYTREANHEIDVLFPKLPNPTLVMFVFPHLAGQEQMPVPGYATSFSMYEKTEFALPGEVSQKQPRRSQSKTNPADGSSKTSGLHAVSQSVTQQ